MQQPLHVAKLVGLEPFALLPATQEMGGFFVNNALGFRPVWEVADGLSV